MGIGIATGAFLAKALGLIDAQTGAIFVIVLALLLLPLVFIDPLHGLLAFAVVAPVSPEFSLPVQGTRAQDLILCVVVLGMIVRQLRDKAVPARPSAVWWLLILYLFYAVATTSFAYVLRPWNRPPDFSHVAKLVEYVVLAFVVGAAVRTPKDAKLLVAALIGGVVIQLSQVGVEPDAETEKLHGTGISESANVLAIYIVAAFAVTLGCLDRIKVRGVGFLLLLLLVATGYAVFSTKSRTGYLSMSIALLVGLFTMRRKFIPLLLLTGGAVAMVLRDDFFERFQTLTAIIGLSEDPSYNARIAAYSQILIKNTATVEGLLFGGGRGAVSLAYADSQWGIELAYGGFLGLLVFASLALSVLFLAIRNWRQTRDRDDILGMTGQVGILVSAVAFLSAFGLTSWSSIRCAEVIFLIIGLSMALRRMLDSETKIAEEPMRGGLPAGQDRSLFEAPPKPAT